MKNPIKNIIKKILISIYLNPLFYSIRKKYTKNKILILLYHEISPELFDDHLAYLSNNYNIVDLKHVFNAVSTKQSSKLLSNPLVITFDDGWKSNYNLMPIIKKYNYPVTIFLTVGLLNTNRKIWNYAIDREGADIDLNEHLKSIPNIEKNKILFDKNGYTPEKEFPERTMLSFDEIEEMKPYVDFQSHGMFHPVLTMCTEEEIKYELRESKEILEKKINKECFAFAFPYGKYNEREVQMVKRAKYKIARITNRPALNDCNTNLFKLESVALESEIGTSDLIKRIAWAEVVNLFNNLLRG